MTAPATAATYAPPGDRGPAPGDLAVVQDLANAHFDEDPELDRDRPMESIAAWLSRHGLAKKNERLSGADQRRMLEFRQALRSLLLSHDGGPDDPAAQAVVQAAAKRAPLVVQMRHGLPVLEPAAIGGVDALLGRMLAIIVGSAADGTWERLKICRADDCNWAFYDRSKNHSGAWCSMLDCGNRAKARAYRQRKSTVRRR